MKLATPVILAGALVLASSGALAQSRVPVRMISGFPPGGNVDILARVFAERLGEAIGRPVVVEARVGAGGQIGLEALKAAPPDGNTLGLTPDASLIVRPLTMKTPPYDPLNDFSAVAHVGAQDYAFAIGAAIPARDLREFAAWAKANGAAANFGSAGQGGATHFLGVLIGEAIGVPLQQISYNGSGPAVTALVAGQISSTVQPLGTVLAQAQAGKIRIVATTGSERSPAAAAVPTLAELGHASLTVSNWFGIFGPARMPGEIVSQLNAVFVKAMRTQAVKDRLRNLGFEVREMTAQQFAGVVKADYERWRPVIKASGFTTESK
jgi:tripartite-type tricarboxylate transporter receptor subunit TctC